MKTRVTLYVLLIVLLLLGQSALAQDEQVPLYEPMDGCFTEIQVDVNFECGYVTVPEFYDGRTEGTIRLAVVRLFATDEIADRNPIFFMDGGPGGSLGINLGLDQASILQELFNLDSDPEAPTPVLDMLEVRDFVLFSQRGTEFSEPVLVCEDADDLGAAALELDFETQIDLQLEALQTCLDAYTAEGVDFNAYTNFANADDVNAVRAALGYDQIVFYGESYGAQLGQHVMQRHPDILEASILDGVNAVSKVTWTQDLGPVLEQGINRLLIVCAEDEACTNLLGSPETLLEDAFARVRQEPVTASYAAPDGNTYEVTVTPEVLAIALETLFVNSTVRPTIPLMLAELRDGDARRIVTAIGNDATESSEGEPLVAGLMHQAMVCADDPPQRELDYDISNYSEFALFAEQTGALLYAGSCELLGLEQLPDDSDVNATVDVPTLVLGGGLDVRTPIFRNQEVADALPNSRLITFEFSDHVQYRGDFAPCAASIVSAFVIDPLSLNDIDASCAEDQTAPTITLPDATFGELIGVPLNLISSSIDGEFAFYESGDATYSITLNEDDMVIQADCNTVMATYVIDAEDTLTVELGASTLVECGPESLSDDVLRIVQATDFTLLLRDSTTGKINLGLIVNESGESVTFSN